MMTRLLQAYTAILISDIILILNSLLPTSKVYTLHVVLFFVGVLL